MTPDQVHEAGLITIGAMLFIAAPTCVTLTVLADRRRDRCREQLVTEIQRDILEDAQRAMRRKMAILAPQPFQAFTDCPHCGHYAYHWLREAPAPPGPRELALGRPAPIDAYAARRQLVDLDGSKVIRTCRKCALDWGQI